MPPRGSRVLLIAAIILALVLVVVVLLISPNSVQIDYPATQAAIAALTHSAAGSATTPPSIGPSLTTTTPAEIRASDQSALTATAQAVLAPTAETQATQPSSGTSVEIAALSLKIVNTSGDLIGDGTARVYYPDSADYPQTARVELELRLDNRYITPTPAGSITPFPVTQMTSTPSLAKPTPTPRISKYDATGLEVYQRMGASLICLAASFEGCDAVEDPQKAKIISVNSANNWSWIIKPKAEVSGLQDLRLELWTLRTVNDQPEQAFVVWDYPFQIAVNAPSDAGQIIRDNLGAIVGAAVIVVVLIGAGYVVWRRKNMPETGTGRSQGGTSQPRVKPKVFISYRRKVGWVTARTIHDNLTSRGADVFIDVDDINEGRFEEIITKAIENSDYFVLVLAPGTLESEWVVKEALHALAHHKKIIPVLVDGFDLYKDQLPDELQGIKSHNALNLTPEFFDAGIERLAKFVGLGKSE